MQDQEQSEVEETWTAADVGKFLRWTPNTVYNRPRIDPSFPRPLKLQEHAKGARHAGSRWLKSEILRWLDERMQKRSKGQEQQMAA